MPATFGGATRKHHAAEEKIRIVLDGQYEDPVCIVAFNTAEGWSRDVTVDIADEVRRRFIEHEDAPASLLRFLEAVNRH